MPVDAYIPDELALRAFLLGRLSATEVEKVERYLESHPEAANTLQALTGEDTFTSALIEAAAIEAILPEVQATMDRLEQVFSPSKEQTATANGTDDSKTGPASVDEEPENALNFLAPAQQPDELGRLGGYRILRVLGAGGMGMVLEAEDPKLGRHVAIKVMLPHVAGNAKARDRFVREARAAAKVEHDHIIPIYFIGEENNVPFIVMPFLKGESLDARLKRERRLPVDEIVRIGREVAEGLAVAHELGLVHRDIKPANLWLEAPRGRIKVLDFGLARLNSEAGQLTQSGAIVGTPAYMAPEQARSQPVDGRSDLFSLGAVLYKMATGRTPFGGSDTISMLMSLANDTPANARSLNPDIPATLADLISRLLEKDPARRPQSAREVVLLLAPPPTVEAMPIPGERRAEFEFEGEEATQVDKVSLADAAATSRPKRQRGPGLLIGVAAVLLLLILGGGFAGYKLVFETKDGTLIVEINDKETETKFKNGELQILDSDGKVKYTLRPSEKNRQAIAPGDYKVRVSGPDGVELDTDAFEMKKGGEIRLRVTVKPPEVAGKSKQVDMSMLAILDPDRRAAEYVLSIGGMVIARGVDREIRAVADLPREPFELTAIVLRGNQRVTDAGLSVCAGCKNLVHVDLVRTPVTDAGVAYFAASRNLIVLDLVGAPVSDGGLAAFKGINTLQHLWLSQTKVTDDGLANFADCKNLFNLDLVNLKITDAGLRHFAGNKNLVGLFVAQTPITDVGLANFKDNKTLTKLWAGDTRLSDTGLAYFKDCKNLQKLWVGGTNLTDAGLEHFKDCKELVDLSLMNTWVTDKGLAHFQDCKKLTSLWLAGTAVTDTGLSYFQESKNLVEVYLDGTKVSDASLTQFKDNKRLTQLKLQKTKVTGSGVDGLKRAIPLCKIEWDGGVIEPTGPSLDSDRELAIEVVKIGGVVVVQQLPRSFRVEKSDELPAGDFAVTDVGLTKTTDANLASVANFLRAKTRHNDIGLQIIQSEMTDDGLKHLVGTNISRLALRINNFSDAGLQHLLGIKNLKSLAIHDSELVTKSGIEKLAAALPGCTIESTHGIFNVKAVPMATESELPAIVLTVEQRKSLQSVLNIGGRVKVVEKGKVRDIGPGEMLPAGPFATLDINYRDVPIGDRHLEALRHVPPVHNMLHLGSTNVTDDGLLAVSEFPGFATIRDLPLTNQPITDRGLAAVKKFKQLEILGLMNAKVTDAGLVHLKGLPLKKLGLTNCEGVTAKCLESLVKVERLAHLDLDNVAISNTDLGQFAKFKKLEALSLKGSNITDEGLEKFHLLTTLTSLALEKCKLSKAALENLAKSMPGCTIYSDLGIFLVKK